MLKPLLSTLSLLYLSLGALCQDQEITFSQADIATSRLSTLIRNGHQYACKCYPGDQCYPDSATWSRFNESVGGNLQLAIPPGAPCFNTLGGTIPTFDVARCADAQSNWFDEQWHTDHPISNLVTFWTNDTCLPLGASPSDSCTRGYYGDYVVLAKTREHVKATIDFARKRNLRLVIRNTGHDFMGRSTGSGSLILNTHSIKDVVFHEKWTGPGTWMGGAVTVGAGVQGRELLRLANQYNPPLAVVTGECPVRPLAPRFLSIIIDLVPLQTVGFAGGFIQGGGHGPLTSIHGMAADQALSFDVVTSSGDYITANAQQNPSLFWALKGGGPSTFAAVLSVTVKTFLDYPSSGVSLRINSTHTTDPEVFWKGFNAFHELSNCFVENGLYAYYELFDQRLYVRPILGPNMTLAELDRIVKPLFNNLDAQGIPYDREEWYYPTFYDLYRNVFEDNGAFLQIINGGRLFTKTDFARNATAINAAHRHAIEQGAFVVGHIFGPGSGVPTVDNAIHPRLRDGSSFSISFVNIPGNASLVEKARAQNLVTNVVGRALREASPHGAAYVNEVRYDRLLIRAITHWFARAILRSRIGKPSTGAQTTLVFSS